ncbi:hypothetical protein ACSXEJ_16890 (plasmid) [Clostridium perfringens]|uniref:Uncharacterized protein n=1 Tax=Clostridium perfringens E str. JGS1987 TaxID=451755 RepID=B1BUB9_CLOPF|nr:hypothetical protein [Clostridium perfringens]EDT14734.1 conserved hypothetical protein [Clostridium perfringens E str. JGS1987]EJT6557633.1 hypothetical protein [Clostridium perfringens]
MIGFTRKERKIIKTYFNRRNSLRHLAVNIAKEIEDKELAKMLRKTLFNRYKVEFISGNEDRLADIYTKEMLEIGVKSYCIL